MKANSELSNVMEAARAGLRFASCSFLQLGQKLRVRVELLELVLIAKWLQQKVVGVGVVVVVVVVFTNSVSIGSNETTTQHTTPRTDV